VSAVSGDNLIQVSAEKADLYYPKNTEY